jgi:hypothetical protein
MAPTLVLLPEGVGVGDVEDEEAATADELELILLMTEAIPLTDVPEPVGV